MDSLGQQHGAKKLGPKIALHFKVCESKATLRYDDFLLNQDSGPCLIDKSIRNLNHDCNGNNEAIVGILLSW